MKKRYIVLIIIIAIIVLPYVYVESNTALFGKQFKELYKQTNMISDTEYYKVFSYAGDKAKVYYVEKGHATGNYVWFTKKDKKWTMSRWTTVWSKYGSADDFTFPLYW